MKIITLFIITISVCYASTPTYTSKIVADLDDIVWGFDFINNDEILITKKNGELFYLNLKSNKKVKLKGPKSYESGQGGLLDLMIYKEHVFLTFTKKISDLKTTALAKGRWTGKEIVDLKTIFEAKVKEDSSRHFGSRTVIKDNLIYMTIGDRGERNLAQDLNFHNGKIVRLTLDGKAAPGNPKFKKTALPEIWSYGHRNAQGIALDQSGEIFSAEFGPRGGDELNHIVKSKNYGWPVITYGSEYHGPSIGKTHEKNMEQPIKYWVPSISPSGMTIYNGNKYPNFKGWFFLANLSSRHLRALKVIKDSSGKYKVEDEVKLLTKLKERIRQVRTSPDGYLYVSTDSGKIIKLIK